MNNSLAILFSLLAIQVSAQQQTETTNVESLVAPEQTLSFSERNLHLGHGKSSVRFTPSTKTTKSAVSVDDWKFDRKAVSDIADLSFLHTLADSNLSFSVGAGFGKSKISESYKSSYSSSEDTEYKYSGMTDLKLNLQNLNNFSGTTNLIYGANMSLSPEKAKLATTKVDGNMYSGGHSLEPYVSIENNASYAILGAKLAYKIKDKKSSEFSEYSYTSSTTGFNELTPSVFIEKNISAHKIGAFVEYTMTEKGRQTWGYENEEESSNDVDASTNQTIGAYGLIAVNNSFAIVPQVSLNTMQTKNRGDYEYDNVETVSTSLELRATF